MDINKCEASLKKLRSEGPINAKHHIENRGPQRKVGIEFLIIYEGSLRPQVFI